MCRLSKILGTLIILCQEFIATLLIFVASLTSLEEWLLCYHIYLSTYRIILIHNNKIISFLFSLTPADLIFLYVYSKKKLKVITVSKGKAIIGYVPLFLLSSVGFLVLIHYAREGKIEHQYASARRDQRVADGL